MEGTRVFVVVSEPFSGRGFELRFGLREISTSVILSLDNDNCKL